MSFTSAVDYLVSLSDSLTLSRHRSAIQLSLSEQDIYQLLTDFLTTSNIVDQNTSSTNVAWLGGTHSCIEVPHFTYKQGQRLLGRELSFLIVDFSQGFDANSFNAALGALKGGGIVFLVHFDLLANTNSKTWLQSQLSSWSVIDKLNSSLELPNFSSGTNQINSVAEQQTTAIQAIEKVLTGHRKRPLVLTANRGRGKTSSLGMAAAQLMQQRTLTIIVTAPSIQSLSPLFQHLENIIAQIGNADKDIAWVRQARTCWQLSNGSQLLFIAPDDLLLNVHQADLVFIDEAAALPLPMLKQFTEKFHRLVMSSTIHGYEGCGRGFSLKFLPWLQKYRPGFKHIHLTQPIRWNEGDPLEQWCFESFLLNAELDETEAQSISELVQAETTETIQNHLCLELIEKDILLSNSALFRSVFSLLVAAHYQTSPNDMTQLLDSDSIQVYQIRISKHLVGCILLCHEGGLDAELIHAIQTGLRRPKGHLVACHLANHLGVSESASQTSARVMRIAIHPACQRFGLGRLALQQLTNQLESRVDFLSVSFGATPDLLRFWSQDFELISLGTKRDQASGSYSAFMVKSVSCESNPWITAAQQNFRHQLLMRLPLQYQQMEASIVPDLLFQSQQKTNLVLNPLPTLLHNYAQGGCAFESVLPSFIEFVYSSLTSHQPYVDVSTFIVIDKVLLHKSWEQVSKTYNLAGRKAVESKLRDWLLQFTV
ncbi:MAG: GNAT family N-acetyltransferase [Vibrio sp.]